MPQCTRDVWDSYLDILSRRDVNELLMHYTESSVLRVCNHGGGEGIKAYTGLGEIQRGFEEFFSVLSDITSFSVQMEEVEDKAVNGNGQVFASWKCPSSHILDATETLLVDPSFKILRHNIVWHEM